jgi:hypothetical protein
MTRDEPLGSSAFDLRIQELMSKILSIRRKIEDLKASGSFYHN